MSVDRLSELHRDKSTGKIEMRPLLAPQSDPASTQRFLDDVTNIQETISGIHDNIGRIRSYQSTILEASDDNEQARVAQQLEELDNDTQRTLNNVKNRVKAIEPNPRVPDFNIRKLQFANLTKIFMDTIAKYRTVQLDFQRSESLMLERQIRVAKPNASQQDIDDAIADAQQGRPIFTRSLAQLADGNRRAQAEGTLKAVQDRHENIRKLAKTIEELSQLFQEMALIVEQQGKMIDQIEVNTTDAVSDLEKANKEIDVAVGTARSTRGKRWLCLGIAVVVLIILVLILLCNMQAVLQFLSRRRRLVLTFIMVHLILTVAYFLVISPYKIYLGASELSILAAADPSPPSTLGFDRIYVINLAHRTDRKKRMKTLARYLNLNLTFVDALTADDLRIDKYWVRKGATRAQLACWRSHMHVYQEIVANNMTSALILEDDIDMEVDIEKRVFEVTPHLPNDWDVWFLGHCHEQELDDKLGHPSLQRSYQPQCTHSYVVSQRGAPKLVKMLAQIGKAIDITIRDRIRTGELKAYSVQPPWTTQLKMKSDPSDVMPGRTSGWTTPMEDSAYDRIRFEHFIIDN
ncbi:t-SNARE [Jimgerdemannia flammicorona]|uniref:t-SNARE n=1 Tax=Jimgerdemannia flammicorona TaxID=994334 RepID=A0A433Q9Y8_9FUNG|nr:t-SNARE [Jimgerdemannia flammicorona]